MKDSFSLGTRPMIYSRIGLAMPCPFEVVMIAFLLAVLSAPCSECLRLVGSHVLFSASQS